MCTVLIPIHPAIAHLEHVRIVPMPGTSEFLQAILRKANHRHAIVRVVDVSGRAPEIAGLRSPSPWGVNSPVTNAEHNWTPRLRQCVAKLCILHLWIQTLGMTPVNLDVVHTP